MSRMFDGASSLPSLEVDHFNTSNVTNMDFMFRNTNRLEELDLSDWNTEKVERMQGVFWAETGGSRLKTLDLDQWKTDNVMTMQSLFHNLDKLTSLDIATWNTSKVTDMHFMFQGMVNLETLDIKNWKTDNVEQMQNMFNGVSKLSTLDLSTWDTSAVTNMANTFINMTALASLNLANWNTNNVINMSNMFGGNEQLSALTLGADFRFLNDTPQLPLVSAPGYTGGWIGDNSGKYFTSSSALMNDFNGEADTYRWEQTLLKIKIPVKMMFQTIPHEDASKLLIQSQEYQFENLSNVPVSVSVNGITNLVNYEQIQTMSLSGALFNDLTIVSPTGSALPATAIPLFELDLEESTSIHFAGATDFVTTEINPKFKLIFGISTKE